MYNLYYHGGSENHGCEAIVRSTVKILGEKAVLHTADVIADKKYGLCDIVDIEADKPLLLKPKSFKWLIAAVYRKIYG